MSDALSVNLPIEPAGRPLANVLFRRRNTALFAVSVLTFSITWLIGSIFGVPVERGFGGSLLAQPSFLSAVVALLAVAIAIAVNGVLLRALLGQVFALEILFSVAIGLLAFSARGGSIVELLQYHDGGIFIVLILETLLLVAGMAAAWLWLRPTPGPDVDATDSDLQSKLTSMAVMAVVMILLMHLLCQTPAKKQAIFSVALSAFGGATVAFAFLGEMSVEPYLLTPVAVAVAGYVLAMFGGPAPTGTPAQVLAYPLPLDYIGAGTAGALFGYWTGLGWKQENEAA